MKKILIFVLLFPFLVNADPPKTKFYDFDDLLINGEYKKPQVLYIDNQAKVRFERLFKIEKNFLPKLRDTKRDSSLR